MSVSMDIFLQALSLPPVQREELAIRLLESLCDGDSSAEFDDSPVEISEEFEEEIHRRLAEHRVGADRTVSMETFLETIRTAATSTEPK